MSVWWCLIDSALVEAICREDETAGTLISVQEAGGRKREQEQVRKAFKLAVYPPVEENVVRLSVAVPMWVQGKKNTSAVKMLQVTFLSLIITTFIYSPYILESGEAVVRLVL